MFNHVAQLLSKTYGIQKQTSPLILHTSCLHTLPFLQDILTYPASPAIKPIIEQSGARQSAFPMYSHSIEQPRARAYVRRSIRERKRWLKTEKPDPVSHSRSPSPSGRKVVRRTKPGPETPTSISSPDPAGSNAESSITEERSNAIKPLTTIWSFKELRHRYSPFVLTAAAAMEAEEQVKKEALLADPSIPNPADEVLRALVGAVAGSETGFPLHHCEGEDSEVASGGIDFHLSASRPGLGIDTSSDDSAANTGEAEQAIMSAVARRLVDGWITQGTT
jgi:hypothetical protein